MATAGAPSEWGETTNALRDPRRNSPQVVDAPARSNEVIEALERGSQLRDTLVGEDLPVGELFEGLLDRSSD